MKWVALVLAVLGAGRALAAPAGDEAAIGSLYRRIEQAYLRRDAAAIMSHAAPGMTATGPGGERITRGELERMLRDQMRSLRCMRRAEMRIRRLTVRGDRATAMIAFRLEGESAAPKGRSQRIVESGTSVDTWRRGPKGWQVVSSMQLPAGGHAVRTGATPPRPPMLAPRSPFTAVTPASGRRRMLPGAPPGLAPIR